MSNTSNVSDYTVGNFDHVIVEKSKLLETIRENKEKHTQIYNAAVSGYWNEAAKVLKTKQIEFVSGVNKLQTSFGEQLQERQGLVEKKGEVLPQNFYTSLSFDARLNLIFPINHIEDYERAINLLEFSVADKVKLSVGEFDQYARNNWAWKKEFVVSSLNYITGSAYAANSYLNTFAVSGMAAF